MLHYIVNLGSWGLIKNILLGTMDVMSLRLPYIFGVMPGRMEYNTADMMKSGQMPGLFFSL
ncbi:hypothetical protein [Paenibacillus motobuensis]